MSVPVRYFVVKCDGQWRVEFEDKHWTDGFKTLRDAIQSAIEAARKVANLGEMAEVLVQGDNKIWHTEWSSADI